MLVCPRPSLSFSNENAILIHLENWENRNIFQICSYCIEYNTSLVKIGHYFLNGFSVTKINILCMSRLIGVDNLSTVVFI